MSALPKSVREKARKADELYAAVYEKKPEAEDENPPAAAEPAETPEPDTKTPVGEAEAPEPVEGAEGEEVGAEAVTEVQPEEGSGQEPWEERYNVLQGKYNAEVPRLNSQIKDLQQQLMGLQGVLSSLETPAETPEAGPAKKLVTDEEVSEYGTELIDIVKRAAREELGSTLETLQAENARLKEALNGVSSHVATTAQSAVYTALDTAVPEWRTTNESPEFLAWLGQRDLFTGQPRGQLLKEAFEMSDAARVVAFFESYRNENATVSGTTETPAPAGKKPAVDMASIAAPGRPRAGATAGGAQEGKRVWTQAEIKAFYADVRRGVYKSTPDKKAAIEADIITASGEGRIVA